MAQTLIDLLSKPSLGKLTSFIKQRLSGKPVGPPIPTKSDDSPEDYIEHTFRSSTDHQPLLTNAFIKLLREAEDSPNASKLPWLGRLLCMSGHLRLPALQPSLVALFTREALRAQDDPAAWRNIPGTYRTTLLVELALSIRQTEKATPQRWPFAWENFLADPDLAGLSFAALTDTSPEHSLPHLPKLLAAALQRRPAGSHPVPIRECLIHWLARREYEHPKADHLTKLLADFRPASAASGERNLLLETLLSIPSAREQVSQMQFDIVLPAVVWAPIKPYAPSTVKFRELPDGGVTTTCAADHAIWLWTSFFRPEVTRDLGYCILHPSTAQNMVIELGSTATFSAHPSEPVSAWARAVREADRAILFHDDKSANPSR